MTSRYDLHCHSNFSDGALSPADLVMRAAEREVTHLALTDHDTTAGLAAAEHAIAEQQLDLQLIPGVEITCRWEDFEIHLVALQFDPNADRLQDLLNQQQQQRLARFEQMLAKLHKAGLHVELPIFSPHQMPTRKHLADALVEQEWVSSFDAVFRRYLGKGQLAYVKGDWVRLEDAIQIVAAAGGVSVIAHPHAYQLSNKWLRRLLQEAKDAGVTGMEVAVGQQSPGQREALATFANELGLSASAGSDFHYPSNWRDLGKNIVLPEACVPIWQHW
ncbi:PHP domain-containing protein [Pseudidiomarina aestuarii]|uniref:PHP domain-containing protein n=1 Tax=Pseudidiomarina aestuarii TaxID=624146 RepID=A0A7Z7ET46_9GAMM|nr:PHP domain-containing protein [Pseudidiomarina aestuarii]RUO40718.1 PHP domain-containing protein [Pseudidiomarina aestuarii]